MSFSATDVTAVRALPVALAVGPDGRWQSEPGFVEIVFQSSAVGRHHQAYVDGRLAGVTLSADDRSMIVPLAEHAVSTIEVIAVDVADRLTDFSASLTGYADAQGSRVRLAWFGGSYLADELDHFDIYGGPAGDLDYTAPLNAEPIPPTPDGGASLAGFGRGGFGRGAFGRSAQAFTFVTAKLAPGPWSFEIVAVDSFGNATGGAAARIDTVIAPPPRPPTDLAVAAYDADTRTATLTWTPGPDFADL